MYGAANPHDNVLLHCNVQWVYIQNCHEFTPTSKKQKGVITFQNCILNNKITFRPGLTSLKETSITVFTAAISAALPQVCPGGHECDLLQQWNQSIWHPISLQIQTTKQNKENPSKQKHNSSPCFNSNIV